MPDPSDHSPQVLPIDTIIIAQTQTWLKKVVVGCNFCPFAAREVQRGSIRFQVVRSAALEVCMAAVLEECERLDADPAIETTLLIFPGVFDDFEDYLNLVDLCEELLFDHDYEGIYQLASFHPDYRFAETQAEDPANYTNRSLYPMLHLLREASLDRVLENYPDPENIPERNIAYARHHGLAQMKLLRDSCWEQQ